MLIRQTSLSSAARQTVHDRGEADRQAGDTQLPRAGRTADRAIAGGSVLYEVVRTSA
jgi:hypothetical protein